MNKKEKTIIIMGAAALLLWIILRQQNTANTPDWANGVSKIGGAMVEVNKTLNEGLKTIFNYSNSKQRAEETYRQIEDHHAKSGLYSNSNWF